jgi:hypothetical protein
MEMKFSSLTAEEQNKVLRVMVNAFYARTRLLFLDLELERNPGRETGYGSSQMDNQDRLMNRLMSSLLITDQGIPFHDNEALKWLSDVLEAD